MTTMLTIEPIPAFSDNYIWLLHDDTDAVVVDPGDAAPVLEALSERSLTLKGVLITHHHFDHVGGIAELVDATKCEVWAPENPKITPVTYRVSEGDTLQVLGQTLQVIEVPGHTLDHIAYQGDGVLFCGDTLFAGGCGRVFEGTHPMMRNSLAKLRGLNPDTKIYCAHEYTLANLRFALSADPHNAALAARVADCKSLRERNIPTVPSLLADEIATNPFMRWDAASVIEKLVAESRSSSTDGDAVFAGLREWKDTF
ncbi:hydroxyacylglutathione hydrolase [Luminiphilus sp. nBUS_16]|uniref:hydroxyacylglutathione hydrolase n=1 Tax=Luminiphilus sp. nBUS_16 TaxID=3395315 RepID=UPI003EB78D6C